MDTFLTQLFGLYFLIVGALVLIRGRFLMPVVTQLAGNRPVLLVFGSVELVAGLALTIVYPTVSLSIPGVISLVGYMMAIEGIIYLAAPLRFVQKLIRTFNTRGWYMSGGVLSVVLGIYLAGTAFGFI